MYMTSPLQQTRFTDEKSTVQKRPSRSSSRAHNHPHLRVPGGWSANRKIEPKRFVFRTTTGKLRNRRRG
jgi:hypothetical protein